MANQSANPFLMEDDYISPPAKPSNPFLMGDEFEVEENVSDNPFIGQDTNPFACGFEEPDAIVSSSNFFTTMDTMPTTMADIIYAQATQGIDTVTTDILLFDDGSNLQNTESYQPQKPMDLNLKDKHRIANEDETLNAYSSEEELNKAMKKIPPARPTPPSKETQDLILSVTGHMEQTSSHLLDRLPATRTPSPVSMRDLHSPSPTPENTFGEFLNIEPKPNVPQPDQPVEMNFFDLDDDSDKLVISEGVQLQNTMVKGENPFAVDVMETGTIGQDSIIDHGANIFMQKISQQQPVIPSKPIVPPQPTLPPQPVIPVAQPPPAIPPQPVLPPQPIIPPQPIQSASPARPAPPVRPTPPRPQPPARPVSPSIQNVPQRPPPPARPITPVQQNNDNDLLDMFGEKSSAPPPPKSKADILNLFSTNTNSTPATADLLSDDSFLVATEVVEKTAPPVPIPPAVPARRSNEPSPAITPTTNPFEVMSDAPIVNEDMQNQLNLSTKTSPQSYTEHVQNQEEIIQNYAASYQPVAPEIPVSVPQVASPPKISSSADDVFDAFAAKFESAEDRGVTGGDPFGASSGSAWGGMDVNTTDVTSGFDADDGGFDTFLAMSEPPPVPQGTPARPYGSKAESLDSEEGKDFSIFIRYVKFLIYKLSLV